jgi:hypothetical protein
MPITGDSIRDGIRAAMDVEIRAIAGGLRRAVERTGRQVQSELRAQARSAGFKDGGRAIANAWRLDVYPRAGIGERTWRPAALVHSNAPNIVDAFDKGAEITAKGGRWLVFPTGYNSIRGRRGQSTGLRVAPEQMRAAKGEAFIIRSKANPNVSLWCLRVREGRGLNRRSRNRIRLFVAGPAEVLTGHRKGQQARVGELLKQGYAPMFLLMRRVSVRKRLDIDAVRDRAAGVLAANVRAELARP